MIKIVNELLKLYFVTDILMMILYNDLTITFSSESVTMIRLWIFLFSFVINSTIYVYPV